MLCEKWTTNLIISKTFKTTSIDTIDVFEAERLITFISDMEAC